MARRPADQEAHVSEELSAWTTFRDRRRSRALSQRRSRRRLVVSGDALWCAAPCEHGHAAVTALGARRGTSVSIVCYGAFWQSAGADLPVIAIDRGARACSARRQARHLIACSTRSSGGGILARRSVSRSCVDRRTRRRPRLRRASAGRTLETARLARKDYRRASEARWSSTRSSMRPGRATSMLRTGAARRQPPT